MGLDGIEIIMLIEDQFQISIPDEALDGVRTVGGLVGAVCEVVDASHDSSPFVEELRSGALRTEALGELRQLLGPYVVDPNLIQPDTQLSAILCSPRRRWRAWRVLRARLDPRVPKLKPPKGADAVALMMIIAMVVAFFATKTTTGWVTVLLMLGVALLCFLVYAFVIEAAATVFPVGLPAGFSSVDDLIEPMAHSRMQKKRAEGDRSLSEVTKHEVEVTVRAIVAEQMGFTLEQVTLDKRLYDDLGLG